MPITEIGKFRVSFLQVLDEAGQLDGKLEPKLKSKELLKLYRGMVLARECDQRMLKLQRQGRIGTFPLCTGQEAAACGVAMAMEERDWLVPAFREIGALLMRGVGFEKTLALYAGYEEGNHVPEAQRTLPLSIPVGSQIPHATGLGFAVKAKGEENTAVVSFFGDGATSEGDFHEALNFAAVWHVPVVFVCLNNGWAISLPTSQQTRSETIAQKAVAYGMEGIRVDGNDVLAVYRAASDALKRARAGGGPSLIEAVTYRLMQHTTSDDPKKYRTQEEESLWWKRDPIPRFRRYLENKDIWDEGEEKKLLRSVKTTIDQAVKRFEADLDVPPDAPFQHVFETQPPGLKEQHEAFQAQVREVDHA